MVKKIIPYNVAIKSTATRRSYDIPKAYTNDLNSVEFQFTITDLTEVELATATANVLLYMRDGSFFQNTEASGVTIDGAVVKYTMKESEGNHSGVAEAQVEILFTGPPAQTFSSQRYQFEILNGLETEVAVEVMIQDWTTLTAEARTFIDNSTIEVNDLKTELQTAITNANTSLGEFDIALQNGIVATNIAAELQNLEATYAPNIVSLTSQLADTLNKSAITLTHMFADNTARDTYFVAHPTELVELQFIKVGTTYQQYIEGVWTDSVPIVAEQVSATNQPIVDTGAYFVAENTNEALQELGAHKASADNPHVVTKVQVGLGNVDNTSDVNKPVSTAAQTALNLKANTLQEQWVEPTLLNAWVYYGIGYDNVGYMKDQFGFVHLKGTVKSGVIGQLILTLPTGYRPGATQMFPFNSSGAFGHGAVTTSGGVVLYSGSSNYVALNGITFKAV